MQYIEKCREAQIKNGEVIEKVGLKTKLASAAMNALSMAGNMLVGMAISAGIQLIVTGLDNIINRTEKLIEAGNKAKQTISDIGDSYNTKQDTVSTNKDKYIELSQGVDNSTNQNLSLTTDQYSEFLSISNQLAQTFPSLVTGYDSQGNALLSLSGNADETSASLEKLLEQERQLADFKISQNLQTAFDGTMAQIGQLQDEIDGLNESIDLYNTLSDSMSKMTDGTTLSDLGFTSSEDTAFMKQFVKYGDTNGQEAVNVMQQAFTKAAKDAGLEENVNFSSLVNQDIFKNGENGYEWSAQLWGATKEQLETFKSSYMAYMDEMGGDVAEYTSDALLLKQQDTQEIQANWQSMVQSLITSMSVYDGYNKLGDNIKQAINTGIGKIDPVKEWMDENGEINAPSNIRGYLREKFLDPITSVLNDESLSLEDKNSFQNTIDSIFSLDKSTLSSQEYQNQLNSYLDSIRKFFDSDEKFNDFVLTFGFKVQTDDGQIIDSRDSLINSISDRIGKGNDTSADITSLDELTYEQLVNVETKYTDSSNGKTLAEIIEEETAKAQNTIDSNPITFSSLFASDEDGSLNKVVDNFQSSMSSIQSIFESINKGEKLDLGDIGQQFPELAGATDNLEESLSNLQIDKVKDFASQYKSLISGITDPQELTKAQQYFQDVLSSIDLSNVNADSLRSQVMDMIWSGITGKDSIDRAQTIMDEFSSELQTQEGLEILFKILADPSNANAEIQNLRSQYDNSEITMKVRVIEDLQSDLSVIQDEASRLQSNIDNKTALGIKVKNSDYAKLIKNGNQQISNLKKQIDATKSLQQEYDKGSEAYKSYQNEIDNLSASIDEMTVKQYEWNDTMQNLPITNAQNLSSAISSALSEIQSSTGLTSDTKKSLTTQFSDLANVDVEDIFYRSANGVKINTNALKDFAEQENEIVTNQFRTEIEAQKKAIEEYQNVIGNNATDDKLQSMQSNLENLLNRQAQYFAEYKSQLEQLSDFEAIQDAKNTENAGSRYNQIMSDVEAAKKAYDNNEVGTDDFKTVAKYLSPNGFDDAANFAENYAKATRYLTEDSSGVVNFLNDLNKKGYATYETLANGVKSWTLNIQDAKKAAYDMGMGEEFFTDVLNKTEDFGFVNATVTSIEEGALKTEEANQKLADAYAKYAEMLASGASTEALQQQQDVIDSLKNHVDDLSVATENYQTASAQAYAEGLTNLKKQVDYLGQMRKEALDSGNTQLADSIGKTIESLGSKYGIKITNFEIDENSYQEALKKAGIGSFENPLTAEDYGFAKGSAESRYLEGATQKITAQKDAMQEAFNTLSQYSAEDLREIQLGNGQYDISGLESAEDALESIALQAGLSSSEISQLVNALEAVGVLKPRVNLDTQQIQEGIDKLKELQKDGKITTKIDLETDISTLSEDDLGQRFNDLMVIKAQLEPDTAEYDAVCALIEQTQIQQKVNLALNETGGDASKLDELLNNDEELAKVCNINLEDDGAADQLEKIKASLQTIQNGADVPITVKMDETQFGQLTASKENEGKINVDANTTPAENKIKQTVDKANKQKGTMKVDANTAPAISKSTMATHTINGMKATIPVDANTSAVTSAINNALSGYHSITVHANVTGLPGGSSSGNIYKNSSGGHTTKLYTGTMLSPSHAYGTAYNVVNYKNAFANGKVGLEHDETALVNELGQESCIRSGKWFLLPPGMHVQSLKRGDIILNAQQTSDLIKHGKANGTARALASGTLAYSGMPSHATNGGGTIGGNKYTSGSSTTTKTTTTKTTTTKDTTSNDTSADEEKSKIDWIEKALDRINQRINRIKTNVSNIYRSFADRRKSLKSELSYTQKELDAQEKAYKKYLKYADNVELSDSIKKKVRHGSYSIGEYDKDTQKLIQEYEDYYKKALDCKDATYELKNSLAELAREKFDMVIQEWTDKLADFQHIAERTNSLIDRRSEYASEYLTSDKSITASRQNISDYQSLIENSKTQQSTIAQERDALKQELANLTADKNSGITKGSQGYNEMVKEIQDLENQYDELSMDIITYSNKISEEYVNMFNTVSQDYENKLDMAEHLATEYNNALELAEAKGLITTSGYYEQMQKIEQEKLNTYNQQAEAMNKALYEAIASGEIEVGSQAYYDMRNSINQVTEAAQEAEIKIEELNNSIRQVKWDQFDYTRDRVADLNDEIEFMISLMKDAKLVDDKGFFTDEGLATIGMYGTEYNTLMSEADEYAAEIKRINAEIANDPYDTKLIERKNQLLQKQRELIQSANDQKQAIKDLVEDGINAQLDSLKELISTYTDALDRQKDLYDYQKKISEQTKNINKLQKELSAYDNDLSEETKAKVQQIKVELEEARADLEETQYDNYISQQKQILDDLYDEYEKALNERLDNLDLLMEEMIATANANAITINDTLVSTADSVGYTMSDSLNTIWGSAQSTMLDNTQTLLDELVNNGKISRENADDIIKALGTGTSDQVNKTQEVIEKLIENGSLAGSDAEQIRSTITNQTSDTSVLATYSKNFNEKQTTTNNALSAIKEYVSSLVAEANRQESDAQQKIEQEQADREKQDQQAQNEGKNNGTKGDAANAVNGSLPTTDQGNADIIEGQNPVKEPETPVQPGKAEPPKKTNSKSTQGDGKVQVGDKVKFNSGSYYYSSDGVSPVGSDYHGKQVYITSINKASWATKPYHISTGKKLGSGDLGWVTKSQISGYASGAKRIGTEGLAWTNENWDTYGAENIVRKSDHAVLTRVGADDRIYNAMASENMWQFANNPMDFINKSMQELRQTSTMVRGGNIENHFSLDNVTFNMPGVTNYKEFMQELQHDNNFERFVQSMTIDAIAGKGTKGKYKINFK